MNAGLSPRQVANQLLVCFRAEADLMRVLGGWTARVGENEERLAFARDVGLRAEHADGIRGRLHRLRTTDRMFSVPGRAWRDLVGLLDSAASTADLVAGVYSVVGEELLRAYRLLVAEADPLADEPTVRLVTRGLIPDHEESVRWAAGFLRSHPADPGFVARVREALAGAGGLVIRSEIGRAS